MKLQVFLPFATYPDVNSDALAGNAVGMAVQLGADLVATAFNADIPPVSNAFARLLMDLPDKIREAEATSRERGEHLLNAVNAEAGRRGLTAKTSSATAGLPLLGEAAAVQARYFDLTLVGLETANPTARMMAEAVVFGSGRPTILLPDRMQEGPIGRIAIAWDGSRVAARAVADALPLLRNASAVTVLAATDEKPLQQIDGAERLAASLRERGLAAQSHRFAAEDCPIGISLQEHAMMAAADLLVMGAYGHSRVRDFVLGGATQGVLDDLRLPVLLAH